MYIPTSAEWPCFPNCSWLKKQTKRANFSTLHSVISSPGNICTYIKRPFRVLTLLSTPSVWIKLIFRSSESLLYALCWLWTFVHNFNAGLVRHGCISFLKGFKGPLNEILGWLQCNIGKTAEVSAQAKRDLLVWASFLQDEDLWKRKVNVKESGGKSWSNTEQSLSFCLQQWHL